MNYYAEVINIIANERDRAFDILVEIAKKNPASVMNAFRKLNLSEGAWRQKAIDSLKSNQKIQAIKICRQGTGLSLKDAKSIIDNLQMEYRA